MVGATLKLRKMLSIIMPGLLRDSVELQSILELVCNYFIIGPHIDNVTFARENHVFGSVYGSCSWKVDQMEVENVSKWKEDS